MFREHFNKKLNTDWGYKGKNVFVDYDSTVYTELQDDLKEKWTWVRELPVSWEYKLELMGLDSEGDNEGLKEIMIPSGFQPLDSFNVVDETLADEQRGNRNGGNA